MKFSNLFKIENVGLRKTKGGVTMERVNTKLLLFIAACAVVIIALCPVLAHAETSYPGVENGTQTTGTTATTNVGLKIDESQLCFTAPAVINFAMKADGSFIAPTDNLAKFTNNSIFDLKVTSFAVTSDSVAKGVASSAFDTATGNNAYKVQVKPNGGTAIDFAVSQSSLSATEWKIPYNATATSAVLGLSFSGGQMKNVTANTWGSGHALQSVVWTIAAA